ncbi:hypothetical protein DPEC_G00345540 [Dallia pectoralis]|uniref:Uncharacterized protein n=1 Tax=Dallia pectoralis TaxID=75939 RepID=A0ACC2F3K5_DALPE|nr:hypothetical protein DPEC_G00345540 [Dallia pectoralis]
MLSGPGGCHQRPALPPDDTSYLHITLTPSKESVARRWCRRLRINGAPCVRQYFANLPPLSVCHLNPGPLKQHVTNAGENRHVLENSGAGQRSRPHSGESAQVTYIRACQGKTIETPAEQAVGNSRKNK